MVARIRAWSPAFIHSMRSRSAAEWAGLKMCSTPAASCSRSFCSGQNLWLIAPDASSTTRRSTLAIASRRARPTRRKSSPSPVCAQLTESQASLPRCR